MRKNSMKGKALALVVALTSSFGSICLAEETKFDKFLGVENSEIFKVDEDNSLGGSKLIVEEKIESKIANEKKGDAAVSEKKQKDGADEYGFNHIVFPIELDCIIPLATSCRPSSFLYLFGLDCGPTPFDLICGCSLEKMLDFFRMSFSNFFRTVSGRLYRSKIGSRYILDSKNKVRAYVPFFGDYSFDIFKRKFLAERIESIKNVRAVISSSKSLGFVCDVLYSHKLNRFAKKMSALYPDKKVTIITVVNDPIAGRVNISVPLLTEKLRVVQFIVPDFSESRWQYVADCIKLNDRE